MDIDQALAVVEAKCDVDILTVKRIYHDAEQSVFAQRNSRGLLLSNATASLVKDEFSRIIQAKAREYLEQYADVLTAMQITDYAAVETRLREHLRAKLDPIYSEGCHALAEAKRKTQLEGVDVHLHADYQKGMGGWIADITLLVAKTKKNTMNQPSVIYNFNGPNARVNNNSVDASVNVVNASEQQLFEDLRHAIAKLADDEAKQRLLAATSDLQAQKDKPSRASSYLQFVAQAANHITVLSPFLPALAQWASQ